MQAPPDRPDAFRAPPAPRPPRWGVVLGAGAAALVSAALVFWIGSGEDRSLSAGSSAPAAGVERAYAPARPDADQVVRAYDQLQAVYADQGISGVVNFGRSCADQLKTDPSVLDFCLAFDTYAAALQGDDAEARAWQAQTGARDLALARGVLAPGADAAARVAAVRGLARQASLEAPAAAPTSVQAQGEVQPPAAPARQPAAAPGVAPPPAAPAQARHLQKPASPAAIRLRASRAAAACRQRATAAQRLVCASPALRDADRRMRLAYRRALAAGVSPRRLARDQARWRAQLNAAAPDRSAVARLYHRRTLTLQAQVRRRHAAVHGG